LFQLIKKEKVMIKAKKACLLATLGGALVLPAAAMAASSGLYHNPVHSSNGKVVYNTFSNCVVSTFTSPASGECQELLGDVRRLTKEQLTVYFDFNRSTLNANEKAKLDSLAKVIGASKEVSSVDIVGYADMIGKPEYNKALSNRRAQTVKSFLATKGLKTRKVRVEGMGESKPVTSCDETSARSELISCLAADRRVEIELNFVK
jgi:outer membrane protein OmpA-like peptidoglycan-associated protein